MTGRASAVQIQFLGATGTVTGSRFLVTARGKNVLVDCGLFQGYKQLRLRNWSPPPFSPRAVHAVILTHAHIDHTGYLPVLVRDGFRGPVYCSAATRDLCGIMLPDAGRLQEEEAEHANRNRWSKHRPAAPLYTEADAVASLKQLVVRDAMRPFDAAGLRATLRPAGHILGACGVLLESESRSVYFSGDVGRPRDAVMKAPAPPPDVDVMVVESTYGDRHHDPADPFETLARCVRRTARRGGMVVVPAFAVGRTQSLLYGLWKLKQDGRIPARLPVFLNSPMAIDTTSLYRHHRAQHRLGAKACAGMCNVARLVNTVEESIRLNRRSGPGVIIAGSGMATGGRVVHHLKAFAPDPRNTILITGFQAGGTRGAALLAGNEMVRIHGQWIPVRAEVAAIDNLSAHADQSELLSWLRRAPRPPQHVYLTHGEPGAVDALRQRIEEKLRWNVSAPEYRDVVQVE